MKNTILLCLFALGFSFLTKANTPLSEFQSKLKSANVNGYDTTCLFKAMAKARRGEPVTLVYIGGSITNGTAASNDTTKYVSLITKWWKNTFKSSKITQINAGIGATGSDIGVFRIQNDVLKYNPDFIVIEFSVNDSEGLWAESTMEGLVRQILSYPSHPAVLMLMLKQSNGTTAQVSHKKIGNYYNVPMVSFADLIDAQVAKDGVTLASIFSDGLHPLDQGMKYVAQFVTDELQKVYSALPADTYIPDTFAKIPTPLIGQVYDKTYNYNSNTLAPISNTGWVKNGTGWTAGNPGDEIVFELDGNSISIMYYQKKDASRGQAEFWIDNNSHKTFSSYFAEDWGTKNAFGLIDGALKDGKHTLHIKISDQSPSGSTGHNFYLSNVLKAGNIKGAAPLAITGDAQKAVKNVATILNGNSSFDPDGDSITGYKWTIVSKPVNSNATLTDNEKDTLLFTPDVAGTFNIGLQVVANNDTSAVKTKTIIVRETNNLPVANAGADITIALNKLLYLDASKSYDNDKDSITYLWRIINQPVGSNATLRFPTKQKSALKVDTKGTYLLGLIVNDSIANSLEDTIVITADDNTKVVGIDNSQFSVDIFPNPTKGCFNISISSESTSKTSVTIYSPDGKQVFSELLDKNLKIINLDSLSGNKAGIYILHAQQGDILLSKKLILSR
jgi:lysophospholipase L1-like esterase